MSDIAASTVNPVTATTPTLLTPASAGASSTSLLPPTSAASAPLSVNTSTAVAAAIPPTGSLTIPTSINSPGELVPAGQSTSLTTTANSNANTSTTNTNATTAANTYNNGYGTGAGMYGGGYGMDPYGMGGMYGMNGLGMMGGLGGMGMMGGLGGMGMMGMGMLGMTPEAQRSQMMMFMISRMVELWGMFSQVIQGAFVSVIQFADNYVSIHQRVGALEDEAMSQEEQFRRKEYETNKEMKDLPITDRIALREHKKQRHARPSTLRRIAWTTFRHAVIVLVAYFIAKKISAWWQARQDNNLLEEVAHKVAGFDG